MPYKGRLERYLEEWGWYHEECYLCEIYERMRECEREIELIKLPKCVSEKIRKIKKALYFDQIRGFVFYVRKLS